MIYILSNFIEDILRLEIKISIYVDIVYVQREYYIIICRKWIFKEVEVEGNIILWNKGVNLVYISDFCFYLQFCEGVVDIIEV